MSGKSQATKRKEAALSLEEARRLFHYDPETGLLIRKVGTSIRTPAGEAAGSFNKTSGYFRVSVNAEVYLIHRLAWFIHYGSWPKNQLDHINRDRADNRIANLREADCLENGKNKSIPTNNTSGVVGVCWHSQIKKWHAAIKVNQKCIYLGVFDTFEEAVAARKAAEVLYGFSSTHCKSE
jgi:hypothetical protein